MIREICKDEAVLARKSDPATAEDLPLAADLLETLAHHQDSCVGMAANMIGVTKRIVAFDNDGSYQVLFNPEILKTWEPYETEESCLSLLGGPRKCRRYQKIKVRYQNDAFQTRIQTFSGFPAEILQHEIDHCNGVLI